MAINNQELFDGSLPAGFDGKFEWDFLRNNNAFGLNSNIDLMDLDAIVERNGRFLVFETKGKGVPIPQGQSITLSKLHQLGCFTIIILRMSEDKQDICKLQYAFPDDTKFVTVDLTLKSQKEAQTALINLVKKWYNDADNLGSLSLRKPINIQLPTEEKVFVNKQKESIWLRLQSMIKSSISILSQK